MCAADRTIGTSREVATTVLRYIKYIRNVGRFEKTKGSTFPFEPLTLIFAENARGKSTLAAILRSLATGDPSEIVERFRLGSTEPSRVVVDCGDIANYENSSWSRTVDGIRVFDDRFVDDNVYSGLAVESEHRKNLHTWIIGSRGVSLDRQLQELVKDIDEHNRILRAIEGKVPASAMYGLSIEDFCKLEPIPDIDEALVAAEQRLSAIRKADRIAARPLLTPLKLSTFSMDDMNDLLAQELATIDEAARDLLQDHFGNLGSKGETWIAERMTSQSSKEADKIAMCPFCGQDLAGVALVDHYRAYFSEEYKHLKDQISGMLAKYEGEADSAKALEFERGVREAIEGRQFWSEFATLPDVAIDTNPISGCWTALNAAILAQLKRKRDRPLEPMALSEEMCELYDDMKKHGSKVDKLNETIGSINTIIASVKEEAEKADKVAIEQQLKDLKRLKERFEPGIASQCSSYLRELASKANTERQRGEVRRQYEEVRKAAFGEYPELVNQYLHQLNAGFEIAELKYSNTSGGSSSTFQLVVNQQNVVVKPSARVAPGEPGFKNTVSSGDRRTLALSVYLAGIVREAKIGNVIAVVDDPVASLDDHRIAATVDVLVRLLDDVNQVVVLSHNKRFLGQLWDRAGRKGGTVASFELGREGHGSVLKEWDLAKDSWTDHDARHAIFVEFLNSSADNRREVAGALRLHLEGYIRVAFPGDFPPGALLGPFVALCRQREGTSSEILGEDSIGELEQLKDYGNKFHHDTNPNWDTEEISDGELVQYVRRVLEFARG